MRDDFILTISRVCLAPYLQKFAGILSICLGLRKQCKITSIFLLSSVKIKRLLKLRWLLCASQRESRYINSVFN
jgi:hypothetical protein